MKNLTEFINEEYIKNIIFEELKVDDKELYELVLETDDYNLYFHKHLFKQKTRHSSWNGQNYISNKKIISNLQKAYQKIVDKYNSNKLKYSSNGKEGFVIIDNKSIDKLCIVGFISDLDKETLKYEICLKTVIYKNDFKLKNNNEFKTIPIILEHINKLIVIYNE